MKHQLKISFLLTFMIAAGAFLLSRATPSRSQQESITTDQIKATLEGMGMKVVESTPSQGEKLLTVMWDRDNFHYETFVSVSQGKWVWFLSPLQGVPDPTQIPQNVLLELLHQNDENGGWYFSWDPTQKRFYLNHLFYYSEVTPENMQSNIDLYEKVLAKSLRYWDPKQWNNPTAPVPSILPQ